MIEPTLTDTDAKQIERLISIYVDQDAAKLPSSDKSSTILSTYDEIHTLDEILHGNANVQAKSCSDVSIDSIWKMAPGMCASILFKLKLQVC